MPHLGQILNCTQDLREASAALDRIAGRTSGEEQKNAKHSVEAIVEKIRHSGDKALLEYTKQFDGFTPEPLAIPQELMQEAWDQTPKPLQKALTIAKKRIKDFHQCQIPKEILINGSYGEKIGRRWHPVHKAGIYIPGGRAAYPSTVLMNAIPASVAGVDEIIMASPANSEGFINKTVLAAAYISDIKKIFRIGGAQAVAAMAYGTETIPKVDVITGPGNIYVTLAKKHVYGEVGIDSLAGPSEILIIADKNADSEQVAADLLAQAEHDPLAAAILLTTNQNLANNVNSEISKQLEKHPRAEICKKSLNNWGLIVVCNDLKSCIELTNKFAPEHVELLTKSPSTLVPEITNAGAIFIGPWSPEATGDYLAGPNHTLPTSGTARFSGALGVETFMKNTSLIEFNELALANTAEEIIQLANSEGLYSHGKSIEIRVSKGYSS